MKTIRQRIIVPILAVAGFALAPNSRAETTPDLRPLTLPFQQVAAITAQQPATTETPPRQHALPRNLLPPLKVSELIGMMVCNPQDQSLGVVRDLAFDAQLGCVAYVAVSSGGLFGMGRPWRAVPPSALNFSAEKRKTLILDISPERWAEAPVFHKIRLNELATEDTHRIVRQFFNQPWPSSEAARTQIPRNIPSPTETARVATVLHVASDILDRAAVTNRQGQNLGKIHDVLLDPNGDKESLAIVELGGASKEKDQFSVPFRLFVFMPGYRSVLLDANRKTFADARVFDAGKWSGMTAAAAGICRFQAPAPPSSEQIAQTRPRY